MRERERERERERMKRGRNLERKSGGRERKGCGEGRLAYVHIRCW